MRRLEWLAKPWRLVALTALLIVLPLLALGEYVSSDTRSRLESAERQATGAAAIRGAELVVSRMTALQDEVFGAARSDDLRSAVLTVDLVADQRLLNAYRNAMGNDIERLLLIDHDRLLARVPERESDPPVADYLVSQRGCVTAGGDSTCIPVVSIATRAVRFITHKTQRPGVALSTPLRTEAVQALVGEVPVDRIALWLPPLLSSARELHLLDENGRLLASADSNGTSSSLDTVADPLKLARSSGDFVAVAPVTGLAWRIVAVRDPAALNAYDRAAGEQRALRLALLGLLVAAAYVTGRVATQLQRERQDLRVANARLDAASEAKSRFLAAVSHDLRTPLNAILGFSNVLLQRLFGELNPKQEEYLRDIHGAGEHQLALVNDLLDLSKIEAGKMELHPVPFSMREAIEGAIAIVRPLADAKGVRLDGSVAPDVGTVEQDPARLKQVVLNLLSNAIKFTDAGGSVRADVSAADGRMTLAVSDTGVGISPEDQAIVFEEFRQVGASARSAQGTGLGLALVRGLVRMMGGEVSLRSAVGEGSTFTVTLPQRQATSV